MYSGQGGFCMGNVAEAAAYYAEFRETSLSSNWESICEAKVSTKLFTREVPRV